MVNLGVATGNASASDIMPRNEGSAVRQTLIVKEDGKPPTQFVRRRLSLFFFGLILIFVCLFVSCVFESNWEIVSVEDSLVRCIAR